MVRPYGMLDYINWREIVLGSEAGDDDTKKSKRKRFGVPGAEPQWPRDRQVDLTHFRLNATFDHPKKSISGVVTFTMKPFNDGLARVTLDSVGLDIHEVTLDGKPIKYEVGDKTLTAVMPRLRSAGRKFELAVTYSGKPKNGLFFVGPDKDYPNKREMIWSQGQDENSRYWFPCYDFPNQRSTSELIATVDERYFCLGNGKLLETSHDPASKTKTYHWREDVPHVTYLFSCVIGELSEHTDIWDGIPISYYVVTGREEEGARSFSRTPEMVKFFSEISGVKYPYEKFAQVAAVDFGGGMENISAVTQTDRTLHPARVRPDMTSDSLVAHELAHMWYGDLITCRTWSHAWLNEGFGTYFDALRHEHDQGQAEFLYRLRDYERGYMQEDSGSYRRPIVCNTYEFPFEIFDGHLYPKAALILHMLRCKLGDDLFFKAIRHYTRKFAGELAMTEDLLGAFEEATGYSLDWYFDQWIYHGGHPELKASHSYDAETGVDKLTIEQTQTPDDLTPIFRFTLNVEYVFETGKQAMKFEVRDPKHEFYVKLPSKPKYLRIDPGLGVIKTLEYDPGFAELTTQLSEDEDPLLRIHCCETLAKKMMDEKAIAALRKCLTEDAFWGVRCEAATALGKTRGESSVEALGEGLLDSDTRVRRSVLSALSEYRESDRALELIRSQRTHENDFVRASTVAALAKTRRHDVYDDLVAAVNEPSWNEMVASTALRGLAEMRDRRVVDMAKERAKRGYDAPLRGAAMAALGKIGEEKKEDRLILDTILPYLEDPMERIRSSAMSALGELGDPRAQGDLAVISEGATIAWERISAKRAQRKISEKSGSETAQSEINEKVERLERENKELRARIESVEKRSPVQDK